MHHPIAGHQPFWERAGEEGGGLPLRKAAALYGTFDSKMKITISLVGRNGEAEDDSVDVWLPLSVCSLHGPLQLKTAKCVVVFL